MSNEIDIAKLRKLHEEWAKLFSYDNSVKPAIGVEVMNALPELLDEIEMQREQMKAGASILGGQLQEAHERIAQLEAALREAVATIRWMRERIDRKEPLTLDTRGGVIKVVDRCDAALRESQR